MKILIINGSPKRGGRVSALTDAVARGVTARGNEVRSLFLADLKIQDCLSCGKCQQEGRCAIRDDIAQVEAGIVWADTIVFATPTHWANVSAHMLRMFERLSGFLIGKRPGRFPQARNAKGRRAVAVVVCGTSWPWSCLLGESGGTLRAVRDVCKYAGMKRLRSFVMPGTDARDDVPERFLRRAEKLGSRL